MGFSGRLEGIAPSDIFQIISQNRMTGTLIARCPDRTAMIVFKEGQVMEATSDAPQESLGHLLVSQGLMTAETIAVAQERLKQDPDQSLGAILVRMGAITEKTLESVVFRQIGHIVHRLMSCDDGFITFDRGEGAVKRKLNTREFFLPSGVSPEYLIMERARVADEERRRGQDRRGQPRVASPAGPEQQRLQPAAEAGPAGLLSWFKAIRLPKAEGLRSSTASVVLKVKEIAGSLAGRAKDGLVPRLKTALAGIRAFSPDGRVMIIAGISGIAAGLALILLTAYSSDTSGSELMVTGRIVNIRANPATTAKVVAKAERGERVTALSFNEGWHEVRTKTGETGWVWNTLVERNESADRGPGYHAAGCGLLLAAGLALLAVGIMRRRRTASAAAPSGPTPSPPFPSR
jgi:hypothetical protein